MPPCPTRNSNQEDDPSMVDFADNAPGPSTRLRETPVVVTPLEPHPEPHPGTPYDVLPDLAQAFGRLTDSLNNSRKSSIQAWIREPDQFDGSDTCKLQLFLTQCRLNFHNWPNTFSNNNAKVTYVLSFFHRTAHNWFEPTLTSSQHAAWLSDYSVFISKLQNNFGPHDPEEEAEAGLEKLCICWNQQITVKYQISRKSSWTNSRGVPLMLHK